MKRIAIAGYGVEGRANYRYWRDKGDVTIVDERTEVDDLPADAKTILGEAAFSRLGGFDLVVRTAGLAPSKINTTGKIWSATNEFFAKCPAPIVGVTGTKGKGTTSSLIASILRASGKTVHLVGNIGAPALEALDGIKPTDIVVYELSSFQLWDLKIARFRWLKQFVRSGFNIRSPKNAPRVAVILPIEPDHLDVHRDFDDYVEAKLNIVRYQGVYDYAIYKHNNDRAISNRIWGASVSIKREYGSAEAAHIQSGCFMYRQRKLCSVDVLKLPGKHNLENACAAIAAALLIDETIDDDAVASGLADFTGLPHRLKFVAEKRGVKYYDDSIGTTVGSSIAAIDSFSEPKILILGGSSKGTGYDEVIQACRSTQTRVLGIGQTGQDIVAASQDMGVDAEYVDGLMKDVVQRASQIANPGDVVVLSPASASFDQYKNYADRGEQFIAAVESLAR